MCNFLKFIVFSCFTSSFQFPSFHSSELPSAPDPLFLFPSEKSGPLQVMIKLGTNHINAGQGNPVGSQGSLEHAKTVRDSPYSHCWESHKLHNLNVYTEDLVLTHTDSLFVTLIFTSAYEPWLVLCIMLSLCPWPLWLLQSLLSFFSVVLWPLPNVWLWVYASVPISFGKKPLWWQLG